MDGLHIYDDDVAESIAVTKRNTGLTKAAADVMAERRRQVEKEGWTPEHDDQHSDGELAVAAACYALSGTGRWLKEALWQLWPREWSLAWLKPRNKREDLVRAGALILAEIERIDRAALPPNDKG